MPTDFNLKISVMDAANTLLSLEFSRPAPTVMNPVKLQRILYIAASEHIKRTDKSLFDEPFEVGSTGPILRSVYDQFRSFDGQRIEYYAKDAAGCSFVLDPLSPRGALLHFVSEKSRDWTGSSLSKLLTMPGSAWDIAYQCYDAFLDAYDIASDESYHEVLR